MASLEVCSALPNTVWPIWSAGTRERSRAWRAATLPGWGGERAFQDPPNGPKPGRTPGRDTTSLPAPWVFMETTLRWSDAGISGDAQVGDRAYSAALRRRQMKYAGTPVARMASSIAPWVGLAASVFTTTAAAARMNNAGVTG